MQTSDRLFHLLKWLQPTCRDVNHAARWREAFFFGTLCWKQSLRLHLRTLCTFLSCHLSPLAQALAGQQVLQTALPFQSRLLMHLIQ